MAKRNAAASPARLIWLVLPVLAFASAVLGVAAVGTVLPRTHETTCRAQYWRAPTEVWKVLTDFPSHNTWRKGILQVDVTMKKGQPSEIREVGSSPARYEVLQWVEPTRIVFRTADQTRLYRGTWSFRIKQSGQGTTVSITERATPRQPFCSGLRTLHQGALRLRRVLADPAREHLHQEVVPERIKE